MTPAGWISATPPAGAFPPVDRRGDYDHGDDDGLRLPPAIAPRQIVVVPMLRDKPEDAEVMAYCEDLVKALTGLTAFGQPVRALLDTKKTNPPRSAGTGCGAGRP